MILRKSRYLWFALISVGPDAGEFFLVNGAVFCRLQLPLNLSQQCSHPAPPQSVPMITLLFRKASGNRLYLAPKQGVGNGLNRSATGTRGIIGAH